MPTFMLTDLTRDLWANSFAVAASDFNFPVAAPWSISKRTLRGGRRDGVDLIQFNNGALGVAIVPTRGMGIWRGRYQGDRIGWDSPIHDGPVHPAFVNRMGWGGLGWLDGFDELLARCGLEHNGAPYSVNTLLPDGSERTTTFGLHGRIANLPASYVAVHVATEPPYEIAVEGHVEETRVFGPQIRMITTIATTPGSNRLRVRDEFVNLKDAPGAMQILYHWNFGAPHLEEGSSLVAPIEAIAPRDERAREGLDRFESFAGPEPGFAEQAYFFRLRGGRDDSRTVAMLRNRAGDKAVVLRYDTTQLPAFTLWKSTGGLKEGYVTGLEPATNYPNPRPFEEARGRVVALPPGGRYVTETVLEVLNTREAVEAVEAEVRGLQDQGPPTVHRSPGEPGAPGA